MGHVPPTFLKTLGGICAKESEHVVLECKVAGDPMPEIKWFKVRNEFSQLIHCNISCTFLIQSNEP